MRLCGVSRKPRGPFANGGCRRTRSWHQSTRPGRCCGKFQRSRSVSPVGTALPTHGSDGRWRDSSFTGTNIERGVRCLRSRNSSSARDLGNGTATFFARGRCLRISGTNDRPPDRGSRSTHSGDCRSRRGCARSTERHVRAGFLKIRYFENCDDFNGESRFRNSEHAAKWMSCSVGRG